MVKEDRGFNSADVHAPWVEPPTRTVVEVQLEEAVKLLRDIYERGRFSKSSDLAAFLEKHD